MPPVGEPTDDYMSGGFDESKDLSWNAVLRSFNSVYLLQSVASPAYFYVGCSKNPLRRLRQHNGEVKKGAWKTREHRPWRLCCVVSGFPSHIAALQFEFRWQRAVVPSQAFRFLCCNLGQGRGCLCRTCAICSAGPRRVSPAGKEYAAEEAASSWERLQRKETVNAWGPALHVQSVIRGRCSKQPQQRLEAELQQMLLLLKCPPFCRFALVVHLLAPDVEDAVHALLTRPQCGGGVLRPGAKSKVCSSLQRLPAQMEVNVQSLDALDTAIQSASLGKGLFAEDVCSGDEQSASRCEVCQIRFVIGDFSLHCLKCQSKSHLLCAAQQSLARESRASLEERCVRSASETPPAEETVLPPGIAASSGLLPLRWNCSKCGENAFWAAALRNLFVLQQTPKDESVCLEAATSCSPRDCPPSLGKREPTKATAPSPSKDPAKCLSPPPCEEGPGGVSVFLPLLERLSRHGSTGT